MKFYRIENKPYYKLKVFATLIDYGIYFILFWFFCRGFGVHDPDTDEYTVTGTLALVPVIYWFLYFVVLEMINQATPGHDICKLKVYATDGQKPSFSQAFKRRVCDPIDIFMWGVPAFICISKTPKHQRIGDLWADTIVAKKTDVVETEVTF